MQENDKALVYGPVPSRRLGRSLGIDLVPFKTCTFDCVYCHVGHTTDKTICRRDFVDLAKVQAEITAKLAAGPAPDYISFAGSGEPTLHSGIGELIRWLKRTTSIPVAVITNGSLLWLPEVRAALLPADLVIPSLDAGNPRLFESVNRPHPEITFARLIEGLAAFRAEYAGKIWLEVLLLAGSSGQEAAVREIAALAARLKPDRVQLNTAVRPPAEDYALALTEQEMRSFAALFSVPVDIVGTATGTPAAADGTARETDAAEVLALLARRPCTDQDVATGLGIHLNDAIKRLTALHAAGKIAMVNQNGRHYYRRLK